MYIVYLYWSDNQYSISSLSSSSRKCARNKCYNFVHDRAVAYSMNNIFRFKHPLQISVSGVDKAGLCSRHSCENWENELSCTSEIDQQQCQRLPRDANGV